MSQVGPIPIPPLGFPSPPHGGGSSHRSVDTPHRSFLSSDGDLSSSRAAGGQFTSRHNEAEDEFGVAKDSRYHSLAAQAAAQATPERTRSRLAALQQQSPAAATSVNHNLAALARLGGGAHEDVALDLGVIDSMPFAPPSTSHPSLTAKSSSDGSAFLKGRETRLNRDEENRFQFANQHLRAGHTSARSIDSSISNGSTTLSEAALGPDTVAQANRRELRAAMERKEEALQAARLRGGSLLSFAAGTGASSAPGPESAPAPAPLKPYVRYTPKYNLPFGDAPRQVAPIVPPQPVPEEDLAQVRSTTLFSVTGAINTHVGITLNTQVFSKNINADSAIAMPTPNAGRRSAGRRSAGAQGSPSPPNDDATQQANQQQAASGAFPTWLQLAVPSLATSPLPIGVRAHSASRKSTGGVADEKEVDDGDVDGTFLTGLNLSVDVGSSSGGGDDRVATRADLDSFSSMTSVETAVTLLPRLLRPSPSVIRAIKVKQDEFLKSGGKVQHLPTPPLPFLDIPPRVDLEQIMELSLESINFQGSMDGPKLNCNATNNTNMLQFKESTFKTYFYSHESQLIIKDTYYWVLLFFFSGGSSHSADATPGRKGRPGNRGQERASDSMPEMYAYRAYASNLKKYGEQASFLTKQKEWLRECERIRQAERESHAQVGTQVQQVNTSANGGGGGGSTGPNPSSSSQAASSTLVSNPKDELVFPPAPVLTAKQKRQPLVLLGDIPHFPVNEKLNTGPIPKAGLFSAPINTGGDEHHHTPNSPSNSHAPVKRLSLPGGGGSSSRTDYTSSNFILNTLKSRISTQFVKLFLNIPAPHKDGFYLHYYDLLAQIIYYAFLVAYPASRPLINHSFFKIRLLQLTSFWIMGFIPSNLASNLTKWRGDIQFITGEAGVNRKWVPPGANNAEGGDTDAGDHTGVGEEEEEEEPTPTASAAATQAVEDYVAPSPSAGSGHTSQYMTQLEKKLNAHLAASSKTARSKAALHATASTLPLAPTPVTASVAALPMPLASTPHSPKRKSLPDVAVSIGHLSSTSTELTGDLLADVGQKATRNPNRVPLRVTRRKVELHHSALIADFLASRHFAHQSNHALRIPLSVPASGDEARAAFLDNLIGLNDAARSTTSDLKLSYAGSKASFNRLQSKQKKELSEIGRKFDQERERALREAAAFSKTLVGEYQEKKYQELKAPSKTLALRRLGHFRQNKETAINNNKSETSATLIKAAIMM